MIGHWSAARIGKRHWRAGRKDERELLHRALGGIVNEPLVNFEGSTLETRQNNIRQSRRGRRHNTLQAENPLHQKVARGVRLSIERGDYRHRGKDWN